MTKPLRVGYLAPNLVHNGVYRWICALAAHTDSQRIEWVGGLIVGPRPIDPLCAAQLRRLMPVHALQTHNWAAKFNVEQHVTFHVQTRDAYQALASADVVLAWELDSGLAPLRRLGIPIVLVSHATGWAPRLPETLSLAHLAAVSKAAAKPFQAVVTADVEILHSGFSLDRIAPRRGRECVRQEWRAGPRHVVTACLDRHDVTKQPQLLHQLLTKLDHRYLGVMYGGDQTGRPSAWLVGQAVNNYKLQFHPQTDAVGDVYAGADVVFSGSKAESFGQTLLEAAAADRPIVYRDGIGVLPELEELGGLLIGYKFGDSQSADALAELVQMAHEVSANPEPGRFLRDYLAAGRMATRWTEYLERVCPRRVVVTRMLREEKPRWRTPERPVRAILLCQTETELHQQLEQHTDVIWTHAVVTQPETLTEPRPDSPTVITSRAGPEWCYRQQDPVRTFRQAAALCDLAVVQAPEAVAREYLRETSVPVVDASRTLSDAITTPFPAAAAPLRACLIVPPLGFGGTEYWLNQLFQHAAAANFSWVGVIVVDAPSRNSKLIAQLQAAGVSVTECGPRRELAMRTVRELQPDAVVFVGLERIGQCIPADYSGPIISVAHNSVFDYWTRSWVRSSDPYASHSVAVSYLAAQAYPEERHEDVAVIYPGVEPALATDRNVARTALGYLPTDVVVCFAGRADRNKRPDLAALGVASLPFNYKFLHVGDIGEWYGTDYDKFLQKRLPNRYKLLPFSADIRAQLAAADVLVLCSYHESFGLVIMQALQQGCRVVATSRSILGELHNDPAWAQAPWVMCDSDDPSTVGQAITEVLTKPLVELPIQARFGAEVASRNFHCYVRHAVQTVGNMRRVQLRQLLTPSGISQPLPRPTAVCDVVLPLVEDHGQNLQSAQALLQQSEAMVFLHAVGPQAQLDTLRGWLNSWRVSYYEGRPTTWFEAFLRCRDGLATEFVFDAHPHTHSSPDRITQMLYGVVNDGLEGSLDLESRVDTGRGCFRRQLLVDLWLSESIPAQSALLPRLAAETGRRFGAAHLGLTHGIAGFAPYTFGGPQPLPDYEPACDFVLPFRGRVEWAKEALVSILAQKNARIRVHLIDDASGTRESAEFLQQALADPRVRAYRAPKNIGQFMAANAAILDSDAAVILVHDGDDLSMPHRAWFTCAALRESAADICTGSVLAFGGSMRILSSTYPHPGSWYSAINPACGFTRAAFERLGGYCDFGRLEANKASLDTDFFLRAAASDLRFHITNQLLVHYRQHVESCTSSASFGIGTPLRHRLEQELATRQIFGSARYVKGCLYRCGGLLEPVKRA